MRKIIFIIGLLFFTNLSSYAQSMEHWVEIGLENSPTSHLQKVRLEAVEQTLESAYEWGETHIELSAAEWMPNDLSPYFRPTVSISQDIPWFGTRKAKEAMAKATIDSEKAKNSLIIAELKQRIKEQYVELQYLNVRTELLEKHKEELESLSDNLLIKLEAGQASAWEVILLENEINEVKAALLRTQYALPKQKELFELLIGIQIDSLEVEPLKMQATQALNEIGKHPIISGLEAEQKELEASKKQLDLDYAPKLNVGMHYEAAMPVEPTYLTHDMIMPSIGFSIPIWTNKKKSKQKLVNLQQQTLDAEIELERNRLTSELQKTKNALYGLEVSWNTKTSSIQNIQDARELLWREYEANKVNLQEITRLEAQLIQMELEQLETNRTYNQQQIYLDFLLLNN